MSPVLLSTNPVYLDRKRHEKFKITGAEADEDLIRGNLLFSSTEGKEDMTTAWVREKKQTAD